MTEKPGKGTESLDDVMLDLERILDCLENSTASRGATAADRAGLLGELERVFERLVRCGEEIRGSAEGVREIELADARIAVLEPMRKLMMAVYKKETGSDLTWH